MRISLIALATCIALSSPALADMPGQVKAMLDAAAAKDAATLKTVAAVAKTASPDAAADIDAYVKAFDDAAEAARVAKLSDQAFLEGWSGQGNVGISFSSGNSKNTNIYVGVGLQKESLKWLHKFNALADFQKNNGVKSREKFGVSLQSNYNFSDRLYFYGLLSWERDPYQGYSRRFTESLGAGYKVITTDNFKFDIEGGPALRQTRVVGSAPAFPFIRNDNVIAGRAAGNIWWKISDRLVLTENFGGLFNKGSDSLYSRTLLTASLTDRIVAGIGFDLAHETAPPAGIKKTDSTTRFTLGYTF